MSEGSAEGDKRHRAHLESRVREGAVWQLWDEARSLKEETWSLPRLPGPGRPLSPGGGPCVSPSARCHGALSARVWWAGRCRMLSRQAGVSHLLVPPSPHFRKLGASAFLWPRFGQTSQNDLVWAPHSLLNPHSSLILRAHAPSLGLQSTPPTLPPPPTEPAASSPAYCMQSAAGETLAASSAPASASMCRFMPVSRAPHGDVEVPGQGEPVLLSPSRPEWSAKCYEPLMPKELPAAGWDTHPSGQY